VKGWDGGKSWINTGTLAYRYRIARALINGIRSLSYICRLISGGLPTRVYYVSQGGYDTHNTQQNSHDRLLAQLGDALGAFVKT
jgi:uncharacterized protein (DUF1501 family)